MKKLFFLAALLNVGLMQASETTVEAIKNDLITDLKKEQKALPECEKDCASFEVQTNCNLLGTKEEQHDCQKIKDMMEQFSMVCKKECGKKADAKGEKLGWEAINKVVSRHFDNQ